MTYIGRQQHNNKTVFYHTFIAARANKCCGVADKRSRSRNRDAALRWLCSLSIWPTLPAPVRIQSRQDICHTLPCPPLCVHRLNISCGRVTASVMGWGRDGNRALPLEDTTCRPLWPLWNLSSQVRPRSPNSGTWLGLWSLTCVSSHSCCSSTHTPTLNQLVLEWK